VLVSQHAQCHFQNPGSLSGNDTAENCYFDLYTKTHWQNWVSDLLRWTAIFPGLAGLCSGVPVAREFEQRTQLIAWGQDITARQWLAAKIAAMLSLSTVVAMIVAVPADALAYAMQRHHLTDSVLLQYYFETGIPNMLGYTVLATAIGLLAGIEIRRTLPALTAAAVSYIAIRLAILAARPYLLPSSTIFTPITSHGGNATPTSGGWFLGAGYVSRTGQPIPDPISCPPSQSFATCLARRHVTMHYLDYQPASHLLPLRLVEGGICLAAAALEVVVCFRVLRRAAR
jgi:hypothetical protein